MLRHGGRKPGSVNKVSREAGQLILQVFHALGGVERMTKWAEANLDVFYVHILPKVLRPVTNISIDASQQQQLVMPVVHIDNPAEALSVLEQLADEHYALRADGGDGDERTVDGALPPHKVPVPEADGSGDGAAEASGDADASAPREDDADGEVSSVPLLHSVPVA